VKKENVLGNFFRNWLA